VVPLWRDANTGVRVVRLTRAEEILALVRLFEGIAETEGWRPEGALRLWRERSVYFALEVEGQLAGGLQLVLSDVAGALPYQAIWPEVPSAAPGRQAHVAILALDGAFRGQGLLFWRLVVEMWRHSVGMGVATLSIEVTPRVLPIYWRLGWPLEIQRELRRHWGEDCYLCSLGIPEVAETLLRRAERSSYYRQIIAQAFRVALSARGRKCAIAPDDVIGVAAS
jgi:ribosomal protein S18 acetylase RimI-like enzyme